MTNFILLTVGANADSPLDETLDEKSMPHPLVRFEDYYPLIGCSLIEPVDLEMTRPDGSTFIICLLVDEEGLLKDSPLNKAATLLSRFLGGPEVLVGNVVIVGETDEDGEMHGLSDADLGVVTDGIIALVSAIGVGVDTITV